jgi:hypothetical protein
MAPKKKAVEEAQPLKRAQLTVKISETMKEHLKALSTLRNQDQGIVLEQAWEHYWQITSEEDRQDAERLCERWRRSST